MTAVSDFINELLTVTPLGLCIICEGWIPPKKGGGRKRRLCSAHCRSAYQKIYGDGRRRAEKS